MQVVYPCKLSIFIKKKMKFNALLSRYLKFVLIDRATHKIQTERICC